MFPEQIKRFIVDSNNCKGGAGGGPPATGSGFKVDTVPHPVRKEIPSSSQVGLPNKHPSAAGINMEAYNAYYSNEQDGGKAPLEPVKANAQIGKGGVDKTAETTKIINNIMHINHSGTNINITSAPNCQNNFIFNHTAPINLNFYKDQLKAQQANSGQTAKIATGGAA